jgi:hypothetical protein
VLLGFSWLHAQLSGTYNITGNSDPSNGQFATIQEAFDSLMSQGVAPPGVTFKVQNSWVGSPTGQDAEPPTIQLSTYNGAASNAPVTLTFADLSGPVYFEAPGQFIFRFTGSIKYFTLDGAVKLILESTVTGGGSTTGLIGFVSSSSLDLDIDAITIQNVVMRGSGRDNTFVGVYIGDAWLGGSATPNSNIGANERITIQGCTIESVSRPILVNGIRANTRNIRVIQDTLGNPMNPTAWAADDNIGAVHLRGVQNPIVQGCVVHGELNNKHSVAGIRLDSCENFTITQNWVYNIEYFGFPGQTRGYGSYGIYIALPSTFIGSSVNNVVSHNMLAGLSGDGDVVSFPSYIPAGIFVEATSGSISDANLALIHNSIHLFGFGGSGFPFSSYTGSSAGIAIGSSVEGGVKIHGNLIQNTLKAVGADTAYGLVIATENPSTAGFDINHNQYYLGGSAFRKVYVRVGTNVFPIFSDWQGSNIPNIPSPDANGLVHEPGPVPFVSNTDLHLVPTSQSSAINAGNPAYNGAFDFDGQTRPIGGGVGGDPGTAPDVGADELAGTPILCPSSLQAPEIVVTTPPLAGSDYLWGQQVEINLAPSSPTPSGDLNIIYSLDGGPWTLVQSVSSFPVTITLPSFTPPNYTGTLQIAVRASAPVPCGLTADTSNNPVSINLSDRPGNRAANAIPITLNSPVSGTWTATISDSTNGLATSDEYNFSTGAPWWSPSRDLFFVLTLPECLDSLVLNTCSGNTNFNTRIHFINASTNDTITSDDQGPSCTSAGSLVSPSLLSKVVVLGLPNALRVTQTSAIDIGIDPLSSKVVRDTALLVSGHTLYIVVEGSNYDEGKFELTITGYKLRPSSISVSGAPTSPVCRNSSSITLTATSGATTYLWKVDGTPQAGANTATFNFSPTSEGTFNVTATAVYNPNDELSCPTSSDSVTSQPVTITVEDTARAQIANASNTVVSGQTLTFTAGSNVTLNALSTQTSGNSYTWNLYNAIPPSGTPTTSTGSSLTISNISAGSYTVILEAERGSGACGTTRDTVYLSVTTGLRTDAGTLSIFPNPNTGAFTIVAPAMDTYRIQVLDVAGRLVAEDAFTGSTHQCGLASPPASTKCAL